MMGFKYQILDHSLLFNEYWLVKTENQNSVKIQSRWRRLSPVSYQPTRVGKNFPSSGYFINLKTQNKNKNRSVKKVLLVKEAK